MPDIVPRQFYDESYFEGRTRQSPAHSRSIAYPLAQRTAHFLCRTFRPSRVLDLGCAKGYLLQAFQAEGTGCVYGVDISQYALSTSDPNIRGRLIMADVGEALPIRNGSFDLVTALDLFEHLANPIELLQEIRRLLSDKGVAYVKICHPAHPNADRDPSHINVRSLRYWIQQFQKVGLSSQRYYETQVSPPTGLLERLKVPYRRAKEWAALGTPADYKFILWVGPNE